MNLLRRVAGWLRPKIPYLNIGLVLGAYLANEYFIQGFCQPVPWAGWVLVLTVGAFLAWPWLKQVLWLRYLLLFLQGALLPACVYCAWFAGPSYLLMALASGFLLVPLLLWTPVLFGAQVLRRAWATSLPGARWVFVAGTLPLLLAQSWAWGQYRQVLGAVSTLPVTQRDQVGSLLRVSPRTYMAERVAGRLFKYHESPEMIYDGWRPPLHDPLLNVCLWIDHATRSGPDYYGLLIIGHWVPWDGGYRASDINDQATFYHALFPNEPVKAACACSSIGSRGYYAWKPGLTDDQGTSLIEVERQQREFDAERAHAQSRITADSLRAASRPETRPHLH